MHMETQDPFYKEQADRLWNDLASPDRGRWFYADHGHRMAVVYGSVNEQTRQQAIKMETEKAGTFPGLDFYAAYYRMTGDARFAEGAQKHFRTIIKQLGGSQTHPSEPLRWGARTITQHTLASVRELCYGSAVLSVPARSADQKEQP